jgi:hypothetical protein
MRRAVWASISLGLALAARSQEPSHPPHAIQDNSFLVEEAYNQEPGVVQHINQFTRDARTGEWVATFTQEYPIGGILHQLSCTIPYQRVNDAAGTAVGLGDLALNYRYQLVGNDEALVAIAPRLTLFAPTADDQRGLGVGSTSVQVAVPASIVLSEQWITHWNAGATWTPSARDEEGDKATTFGYYFGASLIWLGPKFDILAETTWTNNQSVITPHRTSGSDAFLISPGVRWSYDYASGLQIVPGIGIPIGVGPSRGRWSILLYLSFEHFFEGQKAAE